MKCYLVCNIDRALVSDPFIFQEIMKAIELALFRTLPDEDPNAVMNMTEEDACQFNDPEWNHLSLVYQILINIVCSEYGFSYDCHVIVI